MPKGVAPRWRKKYEGAIYYFRGSYADALRQWEAKKVELDRAKIPSHITQALEGYHQYQQYLNGIAVNDDPTTIGGAVDEWLKWKSSQVVMGQLRQGTLSSTRQTITYFRKWAEGSTPLTRIKEKMLVDFYGHLASEISEKKIAKGYAHQILIYTKAFVRRQWEMRRIDLPRNIRSRELAIRVTTPTPKILAVDEIKSFYNRGTGLLKTCILLSLNCGFNQIDIAELRHEEVDWKCGTITKRRIKTGDAAAVPTITWKLWPTTLKLLREHRSSHPQLVLLGRKGQPLIQGGGLERVDVIAKMWRYVRGKLRSKRQYKLLRKTAASKLAEHPVHGRFAQYFLAHAPNSVADRHYIQPSQQQFDEAVEWLGQQFAFLSVEQERSG